MLNLVVPLLVYGALSICAVAFAAVLAIRSGRLDGLDPDNCLVRLSGVKPGKQEPRRSDVNLELAEDVHRLLLESIVLGRSSLAAPRALTRGLPPRPWDPTVTHALFAERFMAPVAMGPSIHREEGFHTLLVRNPHMLPKVSGQHVHCLA